ncbi:MAG: tetratricopeptide repeat protein [Planctomycetes bacterium]|nr:tetratricopeptide repeat protein [Planctomycetota bacterium]
MQIGALSGSSVSAILGGIGGDASAGFAGLLSGSLGGAAAGTGTTASFGPAALLSMTPATSDPLSAPTNAIIAAAYGGGTISAPRPPKLVELEKQTVAQAQSLLAGGETGAARTLLADYLARNPVSGAVVFLQGQTEQATGNYEEAEAFYQKAASIAPSLNAELDVENVRALRKDDSVVLARARRLMAAEDTRDAGLSLLTTLTRRSPRNTEARVLLAETYMAAHSAVKGLFHYSQALGSANSAELAELERRFQVMAAQSPQDAVTQNLLGRAQLKLGKLDEAVETLHRASQLSEGSSAYVGDEAAAIVAVGRRHLERGNTAEAIQQFEQAYLLAPGEATVKLARAEGYLARAERRVQQGDLTSATNDYERAARDARAPGGADLLKRIAQGAYGVGRRLEARRVASGSDVGAEVVAFQAAYDIDPENQTYRRKLAETRYTLGQEQLADADFAAAAGSFRRAYELYKNNSTYKAAAIDAYRRDGDTKLADYKHDAAISAYRLAYQLDTSDSTSKTKLATAYNTAGLFYRDLNERSRAAGYFREALHLYPDNSEYQSNYDSVYP